MFSRKIATLTYRSGPEWDERFKTMKVDDPDNSLPRYRSTEFLIEDYIRHQVKTDGDLCRQMNVYITCAMVFLQD